MPPKEAKNKISEKSVACIEAIEEEQPPDVCLNLTLIDESPEPSVWTILTFFNGHLILHSEWKNSLTFEIKSLSLDLKDPFHQYLIADHPLIFLLRVAGSKPSKENDPFLNADNRAGGTVDLFPLLLGESEVFVKVPLLNNITGVDTHCRVVVHAKPTGEIANLGHLVPLTLTLISAHCLPIAREGTVYDCTIGLNDVHDPVGINFGLSLSDDSATKVLWATASNAGQAANTAYSTPKHDVFIPKDVIVNSNYECISVYWNAMRRVLIDSESLRNRLTTPFVMEVAGVPRVGKIDVRGRYMAYVDAGVLLQPGQYGITVCAKLLFYNELELTMNVGHLLDLPASSAKNTARDTANVIVDSFEHSPYIILRFDLFEPIVLKPKIATLYEIIGFSPLEGSCAAVDQLYVSPPKEDHTIDVRRMRKDCGALAVHKELNSLATVGTVLITQSIKRVAANRLLFRIRSMLKQFIPHEYPLIGWQDTVTSQHAACRRAVLSSFAPQLPIPCMSSRVAISRSRVSGNSYITNDLIKKNLAAAPGHPRLLLCKVLSCLEERNETEAQDYLQKALSSQPRNRYLLWTFGGLSFEKNEGYAQAEAAFQISVKGNMDGITRAIGWAALHTLYHFYKADYAAFVSSSRMRKSYQLTRDWKFFYQEWVSTSGEEQKFWIPDTLDSSNPLLIASAMFLCLRCYKFSQKILECVEAGCANRGSYKPMMSRISTDIYYIKAASLVLRRQLSAALKLIEEGLKKFGPSKLTSQIHATCLACLRGWDDECQTALDKSDALGAEVSPTLLLQAAVGTLKQNPEISLQYVARAHKIAPSAHSALMFGRIYLKIGYEDEAERWGAAAVNVEPLLADGWAFLGILALSNKNIDRARSMFRTAKQVGPISADILEELRKIMRVVKIAYLADDLVKDLCLCDYY